MKTSLFSVESATLRPPMPTISSSKNSAEQKTTPIIACMQPFKLLHAVLYSFCNFHLVHLYSQCKQSYTAHSYCVCFDHCCLLVLLISVLALLTFFSQAHAATLTVTVVAIAYLTCVLYILTDVLVDKLITSAVLLNTEHNIQRHTHTHKHNNNARAGVLHCGLRFVNGHKLYVMCTISQ
jgi:hypothetical protein